MAEPTWEDWARKMNKAYELRKESWGFEGEAKLALIKGDKAEHDRLLDIANTSWHKASLQQEEANRLRAELMEGDPHANHEVCRLPDTVYAT